VLLRNQREKVIHKGRGCTAKELWLLHPMQASLGWLRRELSWRIMCKKLARMAFTITTQVRMKVAQSGGGQLPPSILRMSAISLDLYDSITYKRSRKSGALIAALALCYLGRSTCCLWACRDDAEYLNPLQGKPEQSSSLFWLRVTLIICT
jgi:hypothetical protein